jgi:predicted MFS family arabinose efflux permease
VILISTFFAKTSKFIAMWETDSYWFEVAIVSIVFTIGNIFFGHFEEKSPRIRKFMKYIFTLIIVILLSHFISRSLAMWFLAAWLLPFLYIHAYLLPKNGINGLTAEPKNKYYEFRGWDKDILKETKEK